MLKILGIKKTRTTPLHPQSNNGSVERLNRTIPQESELQAIRAINKSEVRKSVRIVFNKHCGVFMKPPDF